MATALAPRVYGLDAICAAALQAGGNFLPLAGEMARSSTESAVQAEAPFDLAAKRLWVEVGENTALRLNVMNRDEGSARSPAKRSRQRHGWADWGNQGLATCQTLLKPSPVLSPGFWSLAQ